MILRRILLGFVWIVILIAIIVFELCIIPDNFSRWISNNLRIFGDIIFIGGPCILATVICHYIAPHILKKANKDKE